MKPFPIRAAAAVLALALAAQAGAQTAPDDPGAVVILPPMMVSSKGVPWLYARTGDFEVLSRCSSGATREFIGKLRRAYLMLDALVPQEFRLKLSCPMTYILYGPDMQAAVPPALLARMEKEAAAKNGAAPKSGRSPFSPLFFSGDRAALLDDSSKSDVRTPPNLMLFDSDRMSTIALYESSDAQFSIDADCLKALLGAHSPAPPPWFLEGFVDFYRKASFSAETASFAPQTWGDPSDTRAILRDSEFPRRLVPIDLLFARHGSDQTRGDPRFPEVFEAEAELFIRWAFDPRFPARRAQLWKFAALARARPPTTEAQFAQCFGFGYAELLDRLNDALPDALDDDLRLKLGASDSDSPFELRNATGAEVGRIKGDWERLEARYIKTQVPELAGQYLAQSQDTLAEAHLRDPNDPDLLAAMGIRECDAGDDAKARDFLERAVREKVVRPRAYFELARLRFSEARAAPAGEGGRFSAEQAASITAPLMSGRPQSPPLAAAYSLLGLVWARCSAPLPPEQLYALREGARLFPLNLSLIYLAALAESSHGMTAEAAALAERGLENAPDGDLKNRLIALRAALGGASGGR